MLHPANLHHADLVDEAVGHHRITVAVDVTSAISSGGIGAPKFCIMRITVWQPSSV
jgi:hypothetical protein